MSPTIHRYHDQKMVLASIMWYNDELTNEILDDGSSFWVGKSILELLLAYSSL